MIDSYKNILANKYMADTNYIIIKDTDDLEDLERQYELFLSQMTVRQQRRSDDRSIEIWNMTNKQHYEQLKSDLLSKKELHDDKDNQDTYNDIHGDEEDIKDEDITDLISSPFKSDTEDEEYNTTEEEDIFDSIKEDADVTIKLKAVHPIQSRINKAISFVTQNIDRNRYKAPEPSIIYTRDGKPHIIHFYENIVLPVELYSTLEEKGLPSDKIDAIIFSPDNLRKRPDKNLPKRHVLYQVAYCGDKYNVIAVVEDLDRVEKFLKSNGESMKDYLKPGDSGRFTISSKYCTIPVGHDIYEKVDESTKLHTDTVSIHVADDSPVPTKQTEEKPKTIMFSYGDEREKERLADQYEIDTNIYIIGHIKGTSHQEMLQSLEKDWINFNSQSHDLRKKSDDKCREIFGMSNLDRYKKLKSIYLDYINVYTDKQLTTNDNGGLELKTDEVKLEFVSQVYENMLLENKQNLQNAMKHKRLNDCPYFTPEELIDMGVHRNHNWYSDNPDNEALISNISVSTWFDSYKSMCKDQIFEDYRKDWIRTLEKLYSDFDQIKESGNEEKILARKQSILDLGWNPEIPFTRKNRVKAAKRVSDILCNTRVQDIFIDMTADIPDDEIVDESASTRTHKPVFLVFVNGTTPIISDGIKLFTKSVYSHAAIAFSSNLKPLYSYNMFYNGKSGMTTESLTSYKNNDIAVVAFYVPNKQWDDMQDKVDSYISHKTRYDISTIFQKMLHIDKKLIDSDYRQVCSTFVDNILQAGQVDLTKGINLPDPGQLYTASKNYPNKIIEIYNGPASKYDSKQTDKKLRKLLKMSFLGIEESTNILTEAVLPAGYSLRPATDMDKKYMYECEIQSVDPAIADDDKTQEYIRDDVIRSIKDTKMIVYKGQTVGMITASSIDGGKYWYIGEIYLDKPHRNKGIGTTLIKDEMSRHDKIKLQVAQSNTKAKSLYESLGFKVIETNDEAKMYVMLWEKPKSVTTEAMSDLKSSERNDIYHNIEDWESGKSNLIWVVGLSGSGKSTISKELSNLNKAEHVELDNLQRAKIDNWDTTGSKLLDDYIQSKGGMDNIFSYINGIENRSWKALVMNEQCAVQFDDLLNYIMSYANTHKSNKYVVEGVQIAMCSKDATIEKIAKYPVVLKMNGPVKTEFRREKRVIETGIEKKDTVVNILKRVSRNHKNWWKQDFYKKNWDEIQYFKQGIGESYSIFNEVKQFPIEFDKEGNLIIYKAKIGSLDYSEEINDSVKLLDVYRNTNNIEGMKYELAKLWFINDQIEKRLKKRLNNEDYKTMIDTRAICLNTFKYNLEYVLKTEKGFNFSDYYNSTPFSDNSVKITANTIKYTTSLIKSMI